MIFLTKLRRYFMLAASISIIFTACTEDPGVTDTNDNFDAQVLICNEGMFPEGSGSVSVFDRDKNTVVNNIFQTINNRSLGNIVQSVTVHNDRAYIVVNNANKVEVVKSNTFESVASIESPAIGLPRYFLGISATKGYLTQWGANGLDGSIAVIDLENNTVTNTIALDAGAERLLLKGNEVWVVCRGGFNVSNKVFVIDSSTDAITHSISVGDNPNSIVQDIDGNMWVSCGGQKVYDYSTFELDTSLSTQAHLMQINSTSYTVTQDFTFSELANSITDLNIDAAGTILYYNYGFGVYQHDINSEQIGNAPIIEAGFYGLGLDKANAVLYASDPIDYASNGSVIRYQTDGTAIDTLAVGVIPNGGFYFGNP